MMIFICILIVEREVPSENIIVNDIQYSSRGHHRRNYHKHSSSENGSSPGMLFYNLELN